jgi:hypothetical protein
MRATIMFVCLLLFCCTQVDLVACVAVFLPILWQINRLKAMVGEGRGSSSNGGSGGGGGVGGAGRDKVRRAQSVLPSFAFPLSTLCIFPLYFPCPASGHGARPWSCGVLGCAAGCASQGYLPCRLDSIRCLSWMLPVFVTHPLPWVNFRPRGVLHLANFYIAMQACCELAACCTRACGRALFVPYYC